MSGILMDLLLPSADNVVDNYRVQFVNQCVMSSSILVQCFNAVCVCVSVRLSVHNKGDCLRMFRVAAWRPGWLLAQNIGSKNFGGWYVGGDQLGGWEDEISWVSEWVVIWMGLLVNA